MPWRLLIRNVTGHKIRASLTVGSLSIAVFLLCTLHAMLGSLEAGVRDSASNRLIVQSAVSLFVDLPLAYQSKIEAVQGVEEVCKWQWFGGYYREPANFFAQFGVDAQELIDMYPEIELVEGSFEAFVEGRTACLVGRNTAEKFGFRIGDRVPITGTIFQRVDGSPWEFEVAGIYRSTSSNVDDNTLFFNYRYLQESLEGEAASGPLGVGVFVLDLEVGAVPESVMARVDGLFEKGPQRVQTTTEAEFQRQFVSMLGSVPTFLRGIGGGVLFAIMLAVLNSMLMAARERTHDVGVIKALGFTDATVFALMLGEALLLCGLGGALGVGLAVLAEPVLGKGLEMILPFYAVGATTRWLGLGLAGGLGLISGLLPAWQLSRLDAVEALRSEG